MRFWLGLTILLGCAAADPAEAAEGRRFLLAVGENTGGFGDPRLRFAERDAERMVEVMRAIGDVKAEGVEAVIGADADRLRQRIAVVRDRLEREGWGEADQLFVYVSGHAADGALHLKGTRFPLGELRRFVDEAPTGLAVLVLDTCDAGRLTRTKGLVPLTGDTVTVERPAVQGRIYIAASAVSGPAHESDHLGGALFTHHLAAALRGAADGDADGRITLDEAFGYAYARTIEATFGGGRLQTPSYAVRLHGERQVVMTEPARAESLLSFAVDDPGDWVISAEAGDETVRFTKGQGPAVFMVRPGTWRVRTTDADGTREATIRVPRGATGLIDAGVLRPVVAQTGVLRGGADGAILMGAAVARPMVDGGIGAAVGGVSLGVWWLPDHRFWAAVDGSASAGFGAAVRQDEFDLAVGGGVRVPGQRWQLRLGLRGGAVITRQIGVPGGDRLTSAPRAGAIIGLDGAGPSGWLLALDGIGGAQLTHRDNGRAVDAYFGGRLSVGRLF